MSDPGRRPLAGDAAGTPLPRPGDALLRAVRRDPPPAADPSLTPCVRTFEKVAATWPRRIAVSAGGTSMSYGELDARASALAAELTRHGVGGGSLVGLTGRPSPGLVVGIVAVHKLAAGYVPLDPVNPETRLSGIARDSALRVAVDCGGGWRPADGDLDIVHLTGPVAHPDHHLLPAPGGPGTDATGGRVTAGDVAYVLYTSGSTGAPKGVRVTQGNVARLFSATEQLFGFTGEDVWTFYHSFAFDFSVWEIWGALVHGARLVVVPYEVSRDPARFLDLLAAERVTVLSQTPSAFSLLLAEEARRDSPPELALTHVVFGGEALDYRTLVPWVERHPLGRPRLINMYGITETTVHVTAHEVGAGDLRSGARTIGRPLRDLRVYLVDECGAPVPDGTTGEMWVGGAGVALGYLNRPALTRSRFVHVGDPDATVLYRSGDLARVDADCRLVFLGRADDQVKIRGHRIELGEVEAAVRAHPHVESVCVAAEPDERGPTRLVAYLVLAGGAAPAKRDLFAFARTRLPAYMVPQRWIAVPRLPLTINGKVDRAELARSATAARTL